MENENIKKQEIKNKIIKKVNELVDAADIIGSLDYFEINIMHTNRYLNIQLVNKYKEKVQ
jgi:hypothetical protein